MGFLVGRSVKSEFEQRRARRKEKRELERKRALRESSHGKGKREPRDLDEFKTRCEAKDWDNAPMEFWYQFQANHKHEMISWLNRNPKFVPPYGIYIGPDGSEPWRPELNCSNCGQIHRWPECERQ